MAETNFKIFNEEMSADKTYSDSEYEVATQRQTGVIPGMALSRLHNKMYRQSSSMAKGIADFLVKQGYDALDNDIPGLTENIEKAIKKISGDDLNEHNDDKTAHNEAFTAHNTDPAAHANGIAGNAATATTATRLKAALSGSRNQCWLLCKLPKAATALVHYKILGAQYYDQYSTLEVTVKNGFGWCRYLGSSKNYQVSVKAYDDGTNINVYLFAPNFCDNWEVHLQKNGAVSEFSYKKMGDTTYAPTGTLVLDTATGQGCDSKVWIDGKELLDTEHNNDQAAHTDIREALKKAGGMPLGSIMPFLMTAPPAGWLALDTGAIISRATYPELWTWVQANAPLVSEAEWQAQAAEQSSVGVYSSGDGSTTFRLPRIVDYVRGGLADDVGAWQGDAIRNITGTFHSHGSVATGAIKDTLTNSPTWSATSGAGSGNGYRLKELDASRVVPTADENRPKTVRMLYCVKAFNAEVNQGLIDITALANEMTSKVNVTNYIADFAHNHVKNGYQKLPGGLILQWGSELTTAAVGATIQFPIQFPHTLLAAVAVHDAPYASGTTNYNVHIDVKNSTAAGLWTYSNATTAGFGYFAIGY